MDWKLGFETVGNDDSMTEIWAKRLHASESWHGDCNLVLSSIHHFETEIPARMGR